MQLPSPVEIARELVRHDTRNPPGNERACIAYLASLLERAGLEVKTLEFQPGRPSVVARLPGTRRGPALCFAGHVDVVPLGEAPWSFDPFAGEIAGGKLLGRGSSDMKGGVAAFVWAALEHARTGKRAGDVVLVITAAEETGCEGSLHAGASGLLNNVGAIVVAEPTSNRPLLGHRGALWLKATALGRTAHGSMPELGDNAVYKIARAITRIEGLDIGKSLHELLGRTTLNVGTVRGGINLNSVPDLAEFTIDVRSIPGESNAELFARIEAAVGPEITLTRVMDLPAVVSRRDDPWVASVFDIATGHLGETTPPAGAPYFTDASALTPACGNPPTIICGPGEMAEAHKTDEHCTIQRIEEAAEIYLAVASRWQEHKGV